LCYLSVSAKLAGLAFLEKNEGPWSGEALLGERISNPPKSYPSTLSSIYSPNSSPFNFAANICSSPLFDCAPLCTRLGNHGRRVVNDRGRAPLRPALPRASRYHSPNRQEPSTHQGSLPPNDLRPLPGPHEAGGGRARRNVPNRPGMSRFLYCSIFVTPID
jgi:hypothetical protein